MTAPLRVLHLLAPARFGGLERVVQMLSEGQSRAGHAVHVVPVLDAGQMEGHPFLAAIRGRGVEVHPVEVPLRGYRLERRLVRELCEYHVPDIIHTHGDRVDVVHTKLGARLGVPRVTTVHGFIGGGLKNRLYEALQRRSFRHADAVVAVSRPMQRDLQRRLPPGRVRWVPNAWRPDDGEPLSPDAARAALGVPPDVFHIGFVGRLGPEKGPDVLVEALGLLDDRSFAVSMMGSGPLGERLEGRAAELGLGDRIRWHGVVPEARRTLPALDLFVLSSRTEGTPIALLEAMAAGVPVVATRVGGVPDVISDREGILVEAERPDALAEAIAAVRGDPAAAGARALRARSRLERDLDPAAWVARYSEIYREVGAQRGPGRDPGEEAG